MTTTTPLSGPLYRSGSRVAPRKAGAIESMFATHGVRRYAVYVDASTDYDLLPPLPGECAGYHTFDVECDGAKAPDGAAVKLLRMGGPVPEVDGWLVATTRRSSAPGLAKALMLAGAETQVVVRLFEGQTTQATAYMDLLSGETETLVYVNHYFDRKYRILFPLDMKWTAVDCGGNVRAAGQRIIRPDGITVFDTREMGLGEFEGYLRVNLEVENLQVRVQPFLHFWADYISDAGMCRNHQSGWSPWPAGTTFNRGVLPVDKTLAAWASFYNENPVDVTPHALLHYRAGGQDKTVERDLPPIPAGRMQYVNLSEAFADVDLGDARAAYVLLRHDHPLHRPNHYIALAGTRQFVDTWHQTGGVNPHWNKPNYNMFKDRALFAKYGVEPWETKLPLLEDRFEIDTYLGLLSPTLASGSEFTFRLLDAKGRETHREDVVLDGGSDQTINVSEWARQRGADLADGGTFCLLPGPGQTRVNPPSSVVSCGLGHRGNRHVATSFTAGSKAANIGIYFNSRMPFAREWESSPMQKTDKFGAVRVDDVFDSLLVVRNLSLDRDYGAVQPFMVDIFDEFGRHWTAHREAGPNGHDAFWASELLQQAGVESDARHYTFWIKSFDAKLVGFHLLYRRSDHALSMDDISDGTLQTDPQIAGINAGAVSSY